MVNHTSILIISALIIVIPQLGFPNMWQRNMTSALAVLIVILTIRSMRSGESTSSGAGDTFVDTQPIKLAETSQNHHENNG
jgi:hypothetical protein